MMDEFSKIAGQYEPAFITGKPNCLGGSLGRNAATGYGVKVAAAEALKRKNISLAGSTCAVQGFGNVGSWSAKLLYDLGVKIVAVSDSRSAIFCAEGSILTKSRTTRDEWYVAGFAVRRQSQRRILELDVTSSCRSSGAPDYER